MAGIRERLATLEAQREALKADLSQVQDLRRGSLVERYRKCGKSNCGCAQAEEQAHGPSWSLTWEAAGKTHTKVIPPRAVQRTRAQLAEYKRLRRLTRELVEVSEQLCDARLGSDEAEAQATAKKGGSKRRSTPSLRRNSSS
jgi:hypothetical protein